MRKHTPGATGCCVAVETAVVSGRFCSHSIHNPKITPDCLVELDFGFLSLKMAVLDAFL